MSNADDSGGNSVFRMGKCPPSPPPDETMDMDMEMDSIPAHKLFSVPVECVCTQL